MGKIVLTCVLALVFGFGGAIGAGVAFHSQLAGPQGPSGLTGTPGAVGPAGADGQDASQGARGAQGKPGKAASAVPAVTDIGTSGCAGTSVEVVTSANLSGSAKGTTSQKLGLTTKRICIVKPTASATP